MSCQFRVKLLVYLKNKQKLFRFCFVENRKVAEVEVLERSNAASNLQIFVELYLDRDNVQGE